MYKKIVLLYLLILTSVGMAISKEESTYPWGNRIELGYDINKLTLVDLSSNDSLSVKAKNVPKEEKEAVVSGSEDFLNVVVKYVVGIGVSYSFALIIIGLLFILGAFCTPLVKKIVYHKVPK